jgi:hypothetical protein
VNNGVGFAIWRPNVWSRDDASLRKAIADRQLWSEGHKAVLAEGQAVFQTFRRGTVDSEGDQRLQVVLENDAPVAPGTPPQGALSEISSLYDDLSPELEALYRVRESAVLAGRTPNRGYTPKAQLHHSDNTVPDRHNVLLIGAGFEPVGLWIWERSASIVIDYEASKGSQVAHDKACAEVEKWCPTPVFVLLQPGEMIMMHGNVIHAGAKLDANSVFGSLRVHKYMQALHAKAKVEKNKDYTVLLSGMGRQASLAPGTPLLEDVFGRFFDRSEG